MEGISEVFNTFDDYSHAYNQLANELTKKSISLHLLTDLLEKYRVCHCAACTESLHHKIEKKIETPLKQCVTRYDKETKHRKTARG